MKFGLTTEAFQSYVPLITKEVDDFIEHSKDFQGNAGRIEVGHTLAEITIYTASRTLQGKEVRDRFDSTFADLYHDLDMGFAPINFIWPSCPLPANKRRDQARETMKDLYSEIIRQRRERLAAGEKQVDQEKDMLWNLMGSEYKGGKQVPDYEIAHMMIALLMAGQHSSSSTSSWIMLRLASRPHIVEELYAEQVAVLGVGDNGKLRDLTYEDLPNLKLNQQVIKETLRMHAPIHSIMRAVTNPLSIEGTNWTIPAGHVILSSPGYSAMCEEYFPEPENWDPHRWDEDRMKAAMRAEEEEKIDYGYGLVSKGGNSPYLPFGAGRHRCIGEQFANLQLGVIIAALVRHLKLRSPLGKDEFIATDYSVCYPCSFSMPQSVLLIYIDSPSSLAPSAPPTLTGKSAPRLKKTINNAFLVLSHSLFQLRSISIQIAFAYIHIQT